MVTNERLDRLIELVTQKINRPDDCDLVSMLPDELLDILKDLRSHRWISMSERMPELDTKVLLRFGGIDHVEAGFIGDDGNGPYHYFFDGDSFISEPTDWMPYPAHPAENKQ